MKLNEVVELVLMDKGKTFDGNHAFHLHGHSFRVVAMERVCNKNFTDFVRVKFSFFSPRNKSRFLLGFASRKLILFQVNGAGVTREEIIAMDERGEMPRNLDKAVKKDTVTVPDGGYAILRFHATNPGLLKLQQRLSSVLFLPPNAAGR